MTQAQADEIIKLLKDLIRVTVLVHGIDIAPEVV